MRWPWQKRETRSLGNDYSAWLLDTASGAVSPGKAAETAAALSCAQIWASALAASAVEGDRAVTPDLLARIGWRLIARGQFVARIVQHDDDVHLIEPSGFDVRGSPDPRTWRWDLEESGPDGQHVFKNITADRLIRIPWAVSPAAPWSGYGPLSGSTAKALGNIETRLSEEAGSLSALVLPTPAATAKADGQTVDPAAKLGADLVSAKGKPILVETMAAGHGDGRMAAPHGDYVQRRIGWHPPDTIDAIRQHVEQSVYAACGIPPSLGTSEVASGQGMREAFRRFVHGSVAPMLLRVQHELRVKLNSPDLTLSADPLRGEDYAGRARAVAQFVASGIAVDEALRLAGFDE